MLQKFILTSSLVKRYQEEVKRRTKSKSKGWQILPGDPIWKACEKAADLCLKNNWDGTLFILSRFELEAWAQKRFRVKSLPYNLLVSPKPEEIYQEFLAKFKNKWRGASKAALKDSHTHFCQMQDSLYRVSKLKIKPEEYKNFLSWLAPCFLATEASFMDDFFSGEVHEKEIPEVLVLWDKMEDDPLVADHFIRLRDRAEKEIEKLTGGTTVEL